jgi:hypothetical protein
MPAIQPARLKIQVAQLVELFDNPSAFVRQLNDLFFFYADRTRIPGRGGRKYSRTPSYNVSKQVFRHIEKALQPLVLNQEQAALLLADTLWQDNWLESRVLALMILAWIPPLPANRLVSRLDRWVIICKDDAPLLEALAVVLTGLWQQSRTASDTLESWLKSPDLVVRKAGLRTILYLVRLPSFVFLPGIYQLLTPFVQRSSLVPDPDLLAVVRELATRSPQETAYFLHKNLAVAENEGVYALIRRSLDAFSPATRVDLQALLYQRREDLRAG